MSPVVSVIIPVFNYEEFILECVESIKKQTYKNYEIIAVDDGSTDGTAQILKNIKDIRYIYQVNSGEAEARNTGIRNARGEFIAFIDADDKWHPDKLSHQIEFMRQHPDCNIVFAEYEDFFNTEEISNNRKAQELKAHPDPEYLGTALIRKKLFLKNGYFDPKCLIGTDKNWLMGLHSLGEKMDYRLNEVLYLRRLHGENMVMTMLPDTPFEQGQHIANLLRQNLRRTKKNMESKKDE